MSTTTTLKSDRSNQPFEMFSWDLWGHIKDFRGSLDSDRWTKRIQTRMENELVFVTEPLRLEIERLNSELKKKDDQLKNRTKSLRHARIELESLRSDDANVDRGCEMQRPV